MIVSYGDKDTKAFAEGKRIKRFESFRLQAEMRLDRLEASPNLHALRALPGNRLEALKGNRKGQFSIRINIRWRICFEWPEDSPGPVNVEIVDYHN